MIKFESENTTFSLRGVGVVIHNGKLLVQKEKMTNFGHCLVDALKWEKKVN